MQLNMITPADIGIESNKTGELMFDPKEVDGTEASIIGMIAVVGTAVVMTAGVNIHCRSTYMLSLGFR